MNKKIISKGLLYVAALSLLAGVSQAYAADPVVLTFSTVGDSREDPTTLGKTAQDTIWLQNSKAWSRIMRTIQTQKPSMLFFNGDMIMGYGNADPAVVTAANVATSDFYKYGQQYSFWRGMITGLQETGTYVVPVPGNHEVQSKPLGKISQVANENAWRANMGDLIIDKTRFPFPTTNLNYSGDSLDPNFADPTTPDLLSTSQKQLSYSFDAGDSHFTIINTDPVGADGKAPNVWLSNDLASATSRGQKHFFIFGHKPAAPYIYKTGVAPSGMNATSAMTFWGLVEQYKATYFCGHEHIFNVSKPTFVTPATSTTPAVTVGGNAYQVIVGSGGSPFDAAAADVTGGLTVNPATDRTYAWATVQVHQSGLVDIKAYGFSDSFGPTSLINSITLPQ